MKKISIANFKKRKVSFYTPIIGLLNIYINYIRPILDDKELKTERYRALYIPILYVMQNRKWLLTNNFEVLYLYKTDNLSRLLLQHELLVNNIKCEIFLFGIPFYEIIDIISRHKKNKFLNLKAIYKQLNELLTPELTKQLFDERKFSINRFCKLIGITEQAYHNRPNRSD